MPVHRQLGFTLISLLIGMVISLLCISGSLMLYKNLVHVAADTQLDAIYDGQLSSSLLAAQLEMQRAGYGITDKTAPHIKNQTASGTVNIYWRYLDNTTYKCRGLRDTATNSSTRELQLIQTTDAACTVTAGLETLTWSTLSTLGVFTNRASPNAAIISATVTTTNCWPYGVGLSSSHAMVTITAPSAAQKNIALQNAETANSATAVGDNTYSFCLPNT